MDIFKYVTQVRSRIAELEYQLLHGLHNEAATLRLLEQNLLMIRALEMVYAGKSVKVYKVPEVMFERVRLHKMIPKA